MFGVKKKKCKQTKKHHQQNKIKKLPTHPTKQNSNRKNFRTCEVTRFHEKLFQSMVLHQTFLQFWDTLEQMQATETSNLLTQKLSHLSCLDGEGETSVY